MLETKYCTRFIKGSNIQLAKTWFCYRYSNGNWRWVEFHPMSRMRSKLKMYGIRFYYEWFEVFSTSNKHHWFSPWKQLIQYLVVLYDILRSSLFENRWHSFLQIMPHAVKVWFDRFKWLIEWNVLFHDNAICFCTHILHMYVQCIVHVNHISLLTITSLLWCNYGLCFHLNF